MTPTNERKALARSSPAGLAWWASGGRDGAPSAWIPADHLLLLSQKIVDCAMGRCPRLIVTMPPRHGKSELISKYTPAWFLGRFPDKKVMLTSYADTFAAQWGRRSRDILEEFGPELFGVHVDPETAGGQLWEVKNREGIMVTAGVGGGLTGKGAHLLIIDDPIKNQDEAASQVVRDKHHEWWKSTARTRLQKGAAVILVMTRWNEDDLVGRLLRDQFEEDGDTWEVLTLPGIAEPPPADATTDTTTAWCSVSYPNSKTFHIGPDPLGRTPGQPLWPEMFDLDDLHATRRAQGTYWFTAMYQQRPSPAEGLLFKKEHFRYFTIDPATGFLRLHEDEGDRIVDPNICTKFSTSDIAASEKKSADYTVISTWLVTPDRDLLLWDRERVQFESTEAIRLHRQVFAIQAPAIMAIERLGHGLPIIQQLIREGLPIVRLEPDQDKISRALPAVARYEEHRVFHPQGPGYAWVKEEWEPELLGFPHAANDDQVDTVSYAALQLPKIGGRRGSGGQKPASPGLEGTPRGSRTRRLTQAGSRTDRTRRGKGTLTGGLLSNEHL